MSKSLDTFGTIGEGRNGLKPHGTAGVCGGNDDVCLVSTLSVIREDKQTNPSTPKHLKKQPRNTSTLRKKLLAAKKHYGAGETKRKSRISARHYINRTTQFKRLSNQQRSLAAFQACWWHGGKAFTVNLSQHRKSTATRADYEKLERNVARQINRQIKAMFGKQLPFAFCLEISENGVLHAHGVACFPSDRQKDFSTALRKACGKDYKSAARQVLIKELKDFEGWHTYCSKDKGRFYISQSLKQLADKTRQTGKFKSKHLADKQSVDLSEAFTEPTIKVEKSTTTNTERSCANLQTLETRYIDPFVASGAFDEAMSDLLSEVARNNDHLIDKIDPPPD